MGFHPHKSHATHPDHLKAQVELPFVTPPPPPCSRATLQPSLAGREKLSLIGSWTRSPSSPRLSFHQCTTASCNSQTSGVFPLRTIVIKRRRYSCSKMTANKSSLMNMFVLHLKVASLRGVCPTVWVPPKEGQLLSWKGCSVPTVVFGKGARDASAFLVKIFLILALPASVLGVLF